MSFQRSEKYCIIGAGASGIAVAKTFVQRGIPFDLLEREPDIGGLWNIGTRSGIVYDTTHLVSAITTTAFVDFPISTDGPGNLPDYPSHAWVLDYFRAYVRHFGVAPHIQTGCSVESVTPHGPKAWQVKIAGEAQPRLYAGVVVANGHHDKPRRPEFPGSFAGEIIHSRDYKSQKQLRDRRVLVVGAGNSGCDIARDAVHVSGAPVVLSMRRGTWFVPKFILGFPTGDVLANVEWLLTPLPRRLKSWLFQSSLWVLQGPPSRYRLPDPDYRIDQAHPTMNDEIPRLAVHGRIRVRPAIERFDGTDVVFVDGSRESVDLVVLATGYELSIPFLDRGLYMGDDGKPRLYLNTAHPERPGLYFAGLIQANASIWKLAALQGKIIANAIIADKVAPAEAAEFRMKARSAAGAVSSETYVASDRHKLEANYFDYARVLKRVAAGFRLAGKVPYPEAPISVRPTAELQQAAE